MTFSKTAIVLLIVLVVSNVGFAQGASPAAKPAPITLVFQPAPGELHEVVTEWIETENDPQTNLSFGSQLFNIPTAVGQTLTARRVNALWKVLDRDPKGNTVIEITYKYIRSARTFGRMIDAWANFLVKNEGYVVRWDTRRRTTEINPGFAGLEEMEKNAPVEFFIRYFRDIETVRQALANYLIDRPFRIVVDKQGRILEVQDMDLLLDHYRTELAKLTKDFETRAKQDAIVTAFLGEEAVRQSLTVSQLLPYPATPVGVGQKWSDSHEFSAFGRKVPVRREFSVTQSFGESCEVAGTTTYSLASPSNEKVVNLLVTADITTTVDTQSGMFYDLKLRGKMKPTQISANGDNVGLSFEGTTKFSRLATRSTKDRSKWRFYGGYEDFYILLGERWYRAETAPADPNSSIFVDARDKTSITSSIVPKGHQGILNSKENIPVYLELYSILELPVESSNFNIIKTFRIGNVDWYRARIDVKYKAGFGEHIVAQAGFDGTRFFVFYLKGWGDDFERVLTEGTAALDSIEIRNQ